MPYKKQKCKKHQYMDIIILETIGNRSL